MTEAEWLACADPWRMLELLQGGVSERKVRLFACGCVGAVSGIPWEVGEAIKYVEKYCDGLLSWPEAVTRINRKAFQRSTITVGTDVHSFEFPPLGAPAPAVAELTARYCSTGIHWHGMRVPDEQLVRALRDVVGNPFRAVVVVPAWLTSTVLALAEGIYDERAFDRMPILADALQDAGCGNDDILHHCRGEGIHVRGCWVVDLLMGRT